jgi:hypothetical protein
MQNPGTYYWSVWAEDRQKQRTRCLNVHRLTLESSDVEIVKSAQPEVFALHQNYPNPFNPETTIQYDVPRVSRVKLTVYDMLGRRVMALFDGAAMPGKYEAHWNGRDYAGRQVASGLYIVRIEADDFVAQRKMLLL